MNGTIIDPREQYRLRLADAWRQQPTVANNVDNDDDGTDPRAAYLQRLTRDGVPHLGSSEPPSGVRINDSRVVQIHDSAVPSSTLPTIGAALRHWREDRRQGGTQ
jgi:hypothetical protein